MPVMPIGTDREWFQQQPAELQDRLRAAADELARLNDWGEFRALQTVVHVARVYSDG